jgi:hypothetical protein
MTRPADSSRPKATQKHSETQSGKEFLAAARANELDALGRGITADPDFEQ